MNSNIKTSVEEQNNKYLQTKLSEAKYFLEDYFPVFYKNIDLPITLIYNCTHNGGGFQRDKGIRIYTTQPKKVIKDSDQIRTFFGVFKRENAYLITLIHEYCEGLFYYFGRQTKNQVIKDFDLTLDSSYSLNHQFAMKVELSCLDILISEHEKSDKDFIKRRKARLKEMFI
ncbi:MAG: hypothetical protein ABIC91_04610 [Nanoarchaeota archaeon]|nr:hypothetical protein [Nanoarchaeota archaeon]